jgi:hypothetical protein
MHALRSIVLGLVLFHGALSTCFEQEQDKPGQSAIRVQSSLVLVDVISQDPKTGLPVRDFHKNDFRVFDNQNEVPIATFEAGARFDTRPVIVWLELSEEILESLERAALS